jgi:hypothetical protein
MLLTAAGRSSAVNNHLLAADADASVLMLMLMRLSFLFLKSFMMLWPVTALGSRCWGLMLNRPTTVLAGRDE